MLITRVACFSKLLLLSYIGYERGYRQSILVVAELCWALALNEMVNGSVVYHYRLPRRHRILLIHEAP